MQDFPQPQNKRPWKWFLLGVQLLLVAGVFIAFTQLIAQSKPNGNQQYGVAAQPGVPTPTFTPRVPVTPTITPTPTKGVTTTVVPTTTTIPVTTIAPTTTVAVTTRPPETEPPPTTRRPVSTVTTTESATTIAPTTPAATTSAPVTRPPRVPSVRINPISAAPGTNVQITGSGWQPNGNRVTVVLDNNLTGSANNTGAISGLSLAAPVATLGTFDVRDDGTFVGGAIVPNLAPQNLRVVATDITDERASTAFTLQSANTCPNIPGGVNLRLGTKLTSTGNNTYLLCVEVFGGSDGVNLSDTVVINLPSGATVNDPRVTLGGVNVTQNVIRWGSFSVASGQKATLTLALNSAVPDVAGGSSLFVSGTFNRGQSFQQRFNGLPPLVEIVPGSTGGQGGGNTAVPVAVPAAPSAGTGGAQTGNASSIPYLIVAALALIILGMGARFFWLQRRRE
jgi:hypothetical protein